MLNDFAPPVALGLDESETGSRSNLDVYKEHFQLPFIQATEAYYRAESDAFLAENSISDYLKKAEARLAQEEARVERYLHSSSRKSVRGRAGPGSGMRRVVLMHCIRPDSSCCGPKMSSLQSTCHRCRTNFRGCLMRTGPKVGRGVRR